MNMLEAIEQEVRTKDAEIGRLREALDWYEDKVRTAAWGVLHCDYGRTARAALAGKEVSHG
jgi:hypothetical protein